MGSNSSKKTKQKTSINNGAETCGERAETPLISARQINVRPAHTEGISKLNVGTKEYTKDDLDTHREGQEGCETFESQFHVDHRKTVENSGLQKHSMVTDQTGAFPLHGDRLGKFEETGSGTEILKSNKHHTAYSVEGHNKTEDHQKATMTREMHKLREERDIMAMTNKDLTKDKQNLQNTLAQKDTEMNELRMRLSRIASERLTDNNPNIADLSDPNRPVKIAEMYSELYNNEWSDAFEDLTSTGKKSEKEAVYILLEFVKEIYGMCFDVSQKHLDDLKTCIMLFTGSAQITASLSSAMKAFKDERKKRFKSFLPSLTLETNKMRDIRIVKKKKQTNKLQKYLDKSTELCWLMCIQDPPVHLYTDCKKGTNLDETRFTMYTVQGIFVDFLVWPALLLQENGSVLQKGVAQAQKHKQN